MKIRYLTRSEIDTGRWDTCVEQSINPMLYAKSWYLDIVSPDWAGLVGDDYKAVMPLPKRYKWGIPYFNQPPYCQQLGLFSSLETESDLIDCFIEKIPFRPYRLKINYCHRPKNCIEQPNYVLSLYDSYEVIAKGFNKNTLRNINKAQHRGVVVKVYHILTQSDSSSNISIADIFLDFYLSVSKPYNAPNNRIISQLLTDGYRRGEVDFRLAYNSKNEPIAGLALLLSTKRLIYLCPISNTEGKAMSAMFLIINDIIHNYAQTDTLLDFEGSAIESIARFYRGFGAELEPYFLIKRFL
ncbi:MAG: hypothetical protein Q4A56_08390 [Porphyromonadaceae bacterium]|nr:hypothetical protein [Porphyromonadaceae bacterium]